MKKIIRQIFMFTMIAMTTAMATSCSNKDKDDDIEDDGSLVYDQSCFITIGETVALYNQIAFDVTPNDEVENFIMITIKSSEIADMTDDYLVKLLEKSELTKFDPEYQNFSVVKLDENTNYTIILLPYNHQGKRGRLTKHVMKSLILGTNSPIVPITNIWATGNTINWETSPNEYTSSYYTLYWANEEDEVYNRISSATTALFIKKKINEGDIEPFTGRVTFSSGAETAESETNQVSVATWGMDSRGVMSPTVYRTSINLSGENIWTEKVTTSPGTGNGKLKALEFIPMKASESAAIMEGLTVKAGF